MDPRSHVILRSSLSKKTETSIMDGTPEGIFYVRQNCPGYITARLRSGAVQRRLTKVFWELRDWLERKD